MLGHDLDQVGDLAFSKAGSRKLVSELPSCSGVFGDKVPGPGVMSYGLESICAQACLSWGMGGER